MNTTNLTKTKIVNTEVTNTKVAIIGCGDIFPAYLQGLRHFPELQLIAIADARTELAQARAHEFDVPAMSVEALLQSSAQIVINLTPPSAHHVVCMQILKAGKHVYSEKPLAANFAQAQELIAYAKQAQLRVACAPDTFLGAAGQTARELIDSGKLGRIVAGQASMMERGPDDWHPNPEFFYQTGAGPMLDMGVYYLTQLVQLLGPIEQVRGTAQSSWSEREIRRGARKGDKIAVHTPSHVMADLYFASGCMIHLTTSFDVWKHQGQHLELFGEEGSLVLPDPNNFGGTLQICSEDGAWQNVPNDKPYSDNLRGLGVADLAHAIAQHQEHRASGDMALHVLEVMESILLSAQSEQKITLTTTCSRPRPLADNT